MSRKKKSRKPASAPIAKPKLSKAELANVEKRVRKKTGKQAGNRQQEAKVDSKNTTNQQSQKDPRLGSKKPIELGKLATKAEKAQKPVKKPVPLAAVRPVSISQEQTAQQMLLAIEQDEKLQLIITKQEDDLELTEAEVDYYNDMMERHQALTDELGVDEEALEQSSKSIDEESLWDKLDSHDFSDFDKE
ncbi:Der GTPase-activating protein YihI [Litorilituus lipolyticus]|uniref:GTPase-activating protein n=1 Tax=Litorilituus lipolyticus TaxID=2491017 RepID=A0A502KP01_9GAMM|nr:Der GTPase-activating protein YihI [Litorilituus lipolyticus]TPH13470.1 GTPase-activating protein [Litorilituus lipolyticus]